MSKYILDTEKLAEGHWSKKTIKRYANDYFNDDELSAVLFLWLYNNFSATIYDIKYEQGKPMYSRLAKTLTKIFEVQDD